MKLCLAVPSPPERSMFLARRPSLETIDRFLRESQDLPLSYGPIGIVDDGETARQDLDEATVGIGRGESGFRATREPH